MAVAAPADRRLRRAQVRPATRRARFRPSGPLVVRLVLLLALAGGVVFATQRVLSSAALTITRITVSGNSRMSRGEVLSLLDGLSGQPMLTVDLGAWRERLLRSPWVADAALRRVLPGTIAVAISERQPLAVGRVGDELYLLDQRGAVIDAFGPNYAEFDLPIVSGVAAASAHGGPRIDEARAGLAVRLLASLQRHPDLAARLSEIDVSDLHDAAVLLKGDTALVRVGDEQFADRIQSYVDLAPALRARVPEIDYVDVRFDERVYVRPQGAAPAAVVARAEPGRPQTDGRRR